MRRQSWARSLAAGVAALAVLTSSVASAAPATVRTVDPLVALSVFGSSASRAALCTAGAAAVAAGAAQTAQAKPGCVLPVTDAPPPAAVSEVPPPVEAAPAPVVESVQLGMLPFLLALAAFAGFVVLMDNEGPGSVHFTVTLPASPG
jgi:hypothetical protein